MVGCGSPNSRPAAARPAPDSATGALCPSLLTQRFIVHNEPMSNRRSCVDCGRLGPETETDYTLIGSRFGWRLRKERAKDGTVILEWRCPQCWAEYKKNHGSSRAEAK